MPSLSQNRGGQITKPDIGPMDVVTQSRGSWLRSRLSGLMRDAVPDPAAGGVTLPGVPTSVQAARDFVRDCLPGCPRADDLILAVSEYATNAIRYSASGEGSSFNVSVRTIGQWHRVEVIDCGQAALPEPPGNGFGLYLVDEVCDRSGHYVDLLGRRCAWAEVDCGPG